MLINKNNKQIKKLKNPYFMFIYILINIFTLLTTTTI